MESLKANAARLTRSLIPFWKAWMHAEVLNYFRGFLFYFILFYIYTNLEKTRMKIYLD